MPDTAGRAEHETAHPRFAETRWSLAAEAWGRAWLFTLGRPDESAGGRRAFTELSLGLPSYQKNSVAGRPRYVGFIANLCFS